MAISCFTHWLSLTWLAPNSCMAHVQPGFTDTFTKNISGWKAVFDSDDPVHVPLLHKKTPKPLSHWIPMQHLQTANHQPQLSICINKAPWPDKLQEKLTPLQRALVLLAVRADATIPGSCVKGLKERIIGKRIATGQPGAPQKLFSWIQWTSLFLYVAWTPWAF